MLRLCSRWQRPGWTSTLVSQKPKNIQDLLDSCVSNFALYVLYIQYIFLLRNIHGRFLCNLKLKAQMHWKHHTVFFSKTQHGEGDLHHFWCIGFALGEPGCIFVSFLEQRLWHLTFFRKVRCQAALNFNFSEPKLSISGNSSCLFNFTELNS